MRRDLTSLTVLAAILSFGIVAGSASANHKPNADPMVTEAPGQPCKGLGHGVQKSKIWTDPAIGGATMEQHGGAILCGSDFSDKNNLKGFTKGTISIPKGFKVHCMNPKFKDNATHKAACNGEADYQEKLYIGKVNLDVVGVFSDGTLLPLYGIDSKTYVGTAPGVASNEDCTAQAIACYQGTDVLNTAIGNMIIKPKPGTTNKFVLEINAIKAKPGGAFDGLLTKFFFLRIGFDQPGNKTLNMCKYAADKVGEDKCGTKPANYVQKNGTKGTYYCNTLQSTLKGVVGTGWIFDVASNIDPDKSVPWYMKSVSKSVLNKYQIKNCISFKLT